MPGLAPTLPAMNVDSLDRDSGGRLILLMYSRLSTTSLKLLSVRRARNRYSCRGVWQGRRRARHGGVHASRPCLVRRWLPLWPVMPSSMPSAVACSARAHDTPCAVGPCGALRWWRMPLIQPLPCIAVHAAPTCKAFPGPLPCCRTRHASEIPWWRCALAGSRSPRSNRREHTRRHAPAPMLPAVVPHLHKELDVDVLALGSCAGGLQVQQRGQHKVEQPPQLDASPCDPGTRTQASSAPRR